MHELTEDERAIYRALRDTWKYAEIAERQKQNEARAAIDDMHQGQGMGPSFELLAEIDSLAELRYAAQSDFEAFLRNIFDDRGQI